MSKISELQTQIDQTKLDLKSLQSQHAAETARSGSEQVEEDKAEDVGGEEEAPSEASTVTMSGGEGEEGEASFSDSVEQRMSEPEGEQTPAEEVAESEVAPQVKEVMDDTDVSEEGEPSEEAEVDLDNLYEQVYDEKYDAGSSLSETKMREMKEAIEKDPRVKKMALEEPEKFALYMYGRTSVAA
jgi:hypothetical protein